MNDDQTFQLIRKKKEKRKKECIFIEILINPGDQLLLFRANVTFLLKNAANRCISEAELWEKFALPAIKQKLSEIG